MSVRIFSKLSRKLIAKVGQPKVIFEVGSRDALHAVELHKAYPTSDIYSFEPNPEMYQTCISNAAIAGGGKIHIVPMAVSSATGSACLHLSLSPHNPGYTSLYKPSGLYDHVEVMPTRPMPVSCTRLDDFCRSIKVDPPDMMWLDAQGSELNALRGLGEMLANVKAIWTEVLYGPIYEDVPHAADLDSFLHDSGFVRAYRDIVLRDASGREWFGDACYLRMP